MGSEGVTVTYKGTGAFSHLIITADMLTPEADLIDEEAAAHMASAAELESMADTRALANRMREEAIRTPGSEAMHMANRLVVVETQQLADAYRQTAKMYRVEANILRDVDREQANIDRIAHEKIRAAKDAAEIEQIIEQHRAEAEAMSRTAANTIYAGQARWDRTVGVQLAQPIGGMSPPSAPITVAPPPLEPAPQAPENPQAPASPASPVDPSLPDDASGAQNGVNSSASAGQDSGKRAPGHDRSDPLQGASGPGGEPNAVPVGGFPLGGGFGGSGGGLPGGGGLGGGGLGSGLGGGGPLSSLAGLGSTNPASSGLGGGIPGAATPMANAAGSAGLANPGSAFAQGLSSGAAAVGGPAGAVAPPASSAPSEAVPAAGGGVPAAAGGASPAGTVGASGVQSAAAPAAGPVAGGPVPAMLPSTGMGVAPVQGGAGGLGGAATTPASAGGGGGVGGPGAASAVPAGNAGATLVPAAVVNPPEAGPGRRALSEDARRAAKLAGQLQYQCRTLSFPIDWAVGVFTRAGEGSETVIVSAEGSSYVPAGVFVPRGVRLLVADPLLDKDFRDVWFGCQDPAQVLVEYARLRREMRWELVAAATTGRTEALRVYGVEHADSCVYPMSVREEIPGLDGMHVHRLLLEFPDLYDRLERVAQTGGGYRVAMAVAQDLVYDASGLLHPIELPRMWSALVAGQEPTAEQWQHYVEVAATEFLMTSAKQPPTCPVEVYRDAWLVCRALEAVGGFAARPLPLADMVYALAAARPGVDIRPLVEPLLQAAEANALGEW